MKNTLSLKLVLEFDSIIPENIITQIMNNVADGIENQLNERGLTPVESEICTKTFKVVLGNWEVERKIF